MKFGKMITTTLLIFATSTIPAMSNAVTDSLTEEETSAIRQQIGLDLSMPDFKTRKIDDKIIGNRLAQMLRMIDNTQNSYYHGYLARIAGEQNPDFRYQYYFYHAKTPIQDSRRNLQ